MPAWSNLNLAQSSLLYMCYARKEAWEEKTLVFIWHPKSGCLKELYNNFRPHDRVINLPSKVLIKYCLERYTAQYLPSATSGPIPWKRPWPPPWAFAPAVWTPDRTPAETPPRAAAEGPHWWTCRIARMNTSYEWFISQTQGEKGVPLILAASAALRERREEEVVWWTDVRRTGLPYNQALEQ